MTNGPAIVRKTDVENLLIESEGCTSFCLFLPKAQTAILESWYPKDEDKEDNLSAVIDHFLITLMKLRKGLHDGAN